MNDGVKLILVENTGKRLPVCYICLIMRNGTPDNLFDPADGFRRAVYIVVDDNSVVPRGAKLNAGMGTYKSGAAGEKNLH